MQRSMRISVIIPALDEAQSIEATLRALAPLRASGHEVIVVDGGSRDATVALARPLADRVLAAPRGRASQMNAGAAEATGDVLWFLHADTRPPADAASAIVGALRSTRRWGRFDVTIEGRARTLKLVSTMMNRRSRLTGIATGDQAIFVERALFSAVGGYPPLPLMEDIALSNALRQAAGAPACLTVRVATSGRRWEQRGVGRTILRMWRLRFAFWRGVDPAFLARRYDPAPMPFKPTLLVFAKDPAPGRVKTRLATAIGADAAAMLYRELVERTLEAAAEARRSGAVGAVELCCAPDTGGAAFAGWRAQFGVNLAPQLGDDLGERMRNAFRTVLSRGTPAILIGTDIPLLDADYIASAAEALATHDAVLGPAEDGGYVLVGLSRPLEIFGDIAWSTPGVLAATRANLTAQRATWRELAVLWDVDTPADLARYRELPPFGVGVVSDTTLTRL